jgi:hypothetical protein
MKFLTLARFKGTDVRIDQGFIRKRNEDGDKTREESCYSRNGPTVDRIESMHAAIASVLLTVRSRDCYVSRVIYEVCEFYFLKDSAFGSV